MILRRGKAIVALFAVGVAGVAWTGCGSSSSDRRKQLEDRTEHHRRRPGIEDALENGVNEAKESLKGAHGKNKKQLEKAEEEVKKALKRAEEPKRDSKTARPKPRRDSKRARPKPKKASKKPRSTRPRQAPR